MDRKWKKELTKPFHFEGGKAHLTAIYWPGCSSWYIFHCFVKPLNVNHLIIIFGRSFFQWTKSDLSLKVAILIIFFCYAIFFLVSTCLYLSALHQYPTSFAQFMSKKMIHLFIHPLKRIISFASWISCNYEQKRKKCATQFIKWNATNAQQYDKQHIYKCSRRMWQAIKNVSCVISKWKKVTDKKCQIGGWEKVNKWLDYMELNFNRD